MTTAGWFASVVALLAIVATRHSLSARSEAVARACHELRGPLGAIRLGLELGARSGQLSAERLRAIELELGRAALALDDLARAGGLRAPRGGRTWPWRGPPDHPRERVDVQELLADSVEAWSAAAADRGVELRLRWFGAEATVLGERLRLAQATGNLIANAIEHGDGPIEVRGRRDGSMVRVEVVDGGPGLGAPVADLVRARRGRGRSSGTRGRGLSIVTAIAAAHGGRLSGAPSDRGARLVVELPLAEPTAVPLEGG